MLYSNPVSGSYPRYYRNVQAVISSGLYAYEIGYSEFPPGYCVDFERNMDYYILHYVVSGSGTHCGKEFKKGYVYTVCPSEREVTFSDDLEGFCSYWISVRGKDAERVMKSIGIANQNDVFAFEATEACALLLKPAIFDMVYLSDIEEVALMQQVLYKLIAMHSHYSQNSQLAIDSPLSKAVEYINREYFTPIRIDFLAKHAGVSKSQLYSLFKSAYGMSAKEYLLKLRLDRAKEMLVDKNISMSIKEIAFACGFTDPLYFTRMFRKATGQTPTGFKRTGRTTIINYEGTKK